MNAVSAASLPEASQPVLDPAQGGVACDDLEVAALDGLACATPVSEAPVTAAIMFFSGLMAIVGGAVLRSCSTGVEADLMRYWCGPQSSALFAQTHAHCAGCAMLAAGLALMIASLIAASWPRRRTAMERI